MELARNPLMGLRVVELAGVLAGPSLGLFMAEMGAEVIKIENPVTGGDMTRHWKVPGELAGPWSAYFASVNAGKSFRSLDLQNPIDLADVTDLIAQADLVIANFKPASAKKMGLDAATLCAQFPRLVYAEISAFGSDSDRPGFDVVLQAESGFLHMNGSNDSGPVKMPVALIDLLAGHQLKTGVLLALWQREHSGRGGVVRVSLFDAAVASLANQASNWLNAGFSPTRMGLAHPNIAPYGDVFECGDGLPIVLAVGTDAQFTALCLVLQTNKLPHEARFATNAQRVVHRSELLQVLAPLVRMHTRTALLGLLEKALVPAGALRSLPEVFELLEAQRLVSEFAFAPDFSAKVVRSTVFDISNDGTNI